MSTFHIDDDVDVVLKGGGAKGAAHLGAASTLRSAFAVRTWSGTSAGALAAVLLAVGYEPDEIAKLTEKPFAIIRGHNNNSPISAKDFIRIYEIGSMFPNGNFIHWIDSLVRKKFPPGHDPGKDQITFGQIAEHVPGSTNLLIFASDVSKGLRAFGFTRSNGQVYYAGASEHEPVAVAVAASIAIPFVFDAPSGFGTRFMDGGMFANFPIAQTRSALDASGVEAHIVGVELVDGHGPESPRSPFHAAASDVLSAITDARDAIAARELGSQGRLISINTSPVGTLDFHLSREEQVALMEYASLRTAEAVLGKIRPKDGFASHPSKGGRRLFVGDESASWEETEKKIPGRIEAASARLRTLSVSSRGPNFVRILLQSIAIWLWRRFSPFMVTASTLLLVGIAAAVAKCCSRNSETNTPPVVVSDTTDSGTPWPSTTDGSASSISSSGLPLGCTQATTSPYSLLSVTMLVDLAGSSRAISEDTRIVYTALASRDIGQSEEVFLESFSRRRTLHTIEWFGPQREGLRSTGSGQYNVFMSARAGTVYTIVTGVHRSYEAGEPRVRDTNGLPNAVDSHRFVVYANTSDSICELTIVLRSRTSWLVHSGKGYIVRPDAEIEQLDIFDGGPTMVAQQTQDLGGDVEDPSEAGDDMIQSQSISIRTSNLLPGATVYLPYQVDDVPR